MKNKVEKNFSQTLSDIHAALNINKVKINDLDEKISHLKEYLGSRSYGDSEIYTIRAKLDNLKQEKRLVVVNQRGLKMYRAHLSQIYHNHQENKK